MPDTPLEAQLREALSGPTANAPINEAVLRRVDERVRQATLVSSGRSRGYGRRTLAVAMVCLITGAGLAAANPHGIRALFGDDQNDPANKVNALQGSEHVLEMSVLDDLGPDSTPNEKLSSMLTSATTLRSGSFGDPMPKYARLVLRHDTPEGVVLLGAMPTTTGNVCIAYTGRGQSAGTCTERLTSEHPISANGFGSRGQWTILGVAMDGVRSVTVTTTAGKRPAVMGRNVYIWTGPDALVPRSLDVTMEDGTSLVVDAPRIGPT